MNKSTQSPIVLDRKSLHAAAKVLAKRDRHLGGIYYRLGPPLLWKRPATYATFVRIILEQQVSLESAKCTFDRLRTACNSRVTPANVVELGESELRNLGFTRQKAHYAASLAEDVVSKKFRIGALLRMDDDQVRKEIKARHGLGNWSADVYLLMALCRSDVFPGGDLALLKGLRELDGGTYDTPKKILSRAEKWRPYRSVAARMIWQLYLDNRNR